MLWGPRTICIFTCKRRLPTPSNWNHCKNDTLKVFNLKQSQSLTCKGNDDYKILQAPRFILIQLVWIWWHSLAPVRLCSSEVAAGRNLLRPLKAQEPSQACNRRMSHKWRKHLKRNGGCLNLSRSYMGQLACHKIQDSTYNHIQLNYLIQFNGYM